MNWFWISIQCSQLRIDFVYFYWKNAPFFKYSIIEYFRKKEIFFFFNYSLAVFSGWAFSVHYHMQMSAEECDIQLLGSWMYCVTVKCCCREFPSFFVFQSTYSWMVSSIAPHSTLPMGVSCTVLRHPSHHFSPMYSYTLHGAYYCGV